MIPGIPSRIMVPVASSIRISSVSGTYFTVTRMFIVLSSTPIGIFLDPQEGYNNIS